MLHSHSGRSTNDVVQQVRRIISPVASSDDSPSNGVGSPRDFSAAGKALPAFSMVVDRRFPAFRDPRRGCGEGEVLPFPSLIRANSKVPGNFPPRSEEKKEREREKGGGGKKISFFGASI